MTITIYKKSTFIIYQNVYRFVHHSDGEIKMCIVNEDNTFTNVYLDDNEYEWYSIGDK